MIGRPFALGYGKGDRYSKITSNDLTDCLSSTFPSFFVSLTPVFGVWSAVTPYGKRAVKVLFHFFDLANAIGVNGTLTEIISS